MYNSNNQESRAILLVAEFPVPLVATVVSNLVLSHERRKKGRVATTTN
jgi:hypothetical protein